MTYNFKKTNELAGRIMQELKDSDPRVAYPALRICQFLVEQYCLDPINHVDDL